MLVEPSSPCWQPLSLSCQSTSRWSSSRLWNRQWNVLVNPHKRIHYAYRYTWCCCSLAGWYRWLGHEYHHNHSDLPLEMTGMLVARVIGVFVAPLGAVLGYF